MSAVQKALWHIETRLSQPITLADLAGAGGVSPHHLARAFVASFGVPPLRYARLRRLSRAAEALAAGAPDILTLALDAGYGSHEAFTRAFRDAFGLTPEAVRAMGHTATLSLQEVIRMDSTRTVTLSPPAHRPHPAFQIVGMAGTYTRATVLGIPQLWERFAPHIGHIPGQAGWTSYGLISMTEDGESFEYLAGVEVAPGHELPEGMVRRQLPARDYAVFEHRGHISGLRDTLHAIWNDWLPSAAFVPLRGAADFERYDERFDPVSGQGVVEIWLPVVPKP